MAAASLGRLMTFVSEVDGTGRLTTMMLFESTEAQGQTIMAKKLTSSRRNKARRLAQRAVQRAALAVPDAQPLSVADLKRMKRTPQAKIIRRALGLTQEEFAARYHIPLGTLRDWEQGRAMPDRPTQAYLTVIARSPEDVQHALER